MGKKEKKEKKEKPLDRMTAKELREFALGMGGEIVGVHGMNKDELLAAVKEAKGVVDDNKNAAKPFHVREIKEKIQAVRAVKTAAQEAGEPRSKINILRKRINRLRKKTHKAA
jgi:hypothetical protein